MPEKKLGFGTMRLPLTDPEDRTSVDIPQFCKMVDTFIERGFTYFDTAWMYHGFASERAVKTALVDRYPRDAYTLATKLHIHFADTAADCDRIFDEQRQKTGVEYFDYYLLHSITRDNIEKYEKFDAFNWIAEKKRQGLIRHMGFSFHADAELLEEILTAHPEMEFVQLQLNYLDWDSESVQSRLCYETVLRHGKQVVVMEPVKGGTLAQVPTAVEGVFKAVHPDWSPASWALRFAAGLPGVMAVLSGMSDIAQLEENTALFAQTPSLNDTEAAAVRRAAEILSGGNAIPCTGCSYCTEGCPMGVAIPELFTLYNADQRVRDEDAPAADLPDNKAAYAALGESKALADACIACGQCEGVCPQHLPIIEHLTQVNTHFSK